MAQIAARVGQIPQPGLPSVIAVLLLCSFGVKAAVFPLFFWLPASYHTPPVAVTAVFSGLLTKVGVNAIIRTFTLMFVGDSGYTHTILLVVGALTMMTGVLGAVAQMEVRRLLSFHIVSQIGYLLMGLGLHSIAGLAATVVFLVHVIMAKAALFMIGGIVHRKRGTYDLARLGGLVRESPALAALFLLPALALAGVPPLSGFWAKFFLIRAGLLEGEWVMVVVALGVSVLTLYSMMKIWNEAFWKNPPEGIAESAPALAGSVKGVLLYGPPLVLAGLTLLLGLAIGPIYEVATAAAEQLMSPHLYISAVLGGAP
jgi:multicomponent Na+:H+ antiporter subunit D